MNNRKNVYYELTTVHIRLRHNQQTVHPIELVKKALIDHIHIPSESNLQFATYHHKNETPPRTYPSEKLFTISTKKTGTSHSIHPHISFLISFSMKCREESANMEQHFVFWHLAPNEMSKSSSLKRQIYLAIRLWCLTVCTDNFLTTPKAKCIYNPSEEIPGRHGVLHIFNYKTVLSNAKSKLVNGSCTFTHSTDSTGPQKMFHFFP